MPREKVQMPTPEANGFVKTLNNMGFMTSILDPYSQALVDFAPQAPGPFLEIGAAYGVASLAALEKGCEVIANDMDERHLEILWDRASKEYQKRLTLKAGVFPDSLNLKPGSVGAILVCRVFHFFTGPMIEKSLSRMFDWLAPGGKVAVIAETPYIGFLRDFVPVYEARSAAGEKWPGFVEDIMAFNPERGKFLPKLMHLLDPKVLTRLLTQAGFEIETVSLLARPYFPEDVQLDGRESVAAIAIKR